MCCAMDKSLQSLDQVKASALDMAVRFGPKLFTAIVILIIGYFVGGWGVGTSVTRSTSGPPGVVSTIARIRECLLTLAP